MKYDHEPYKWRRFDTLRSVYALASVLGGAALDLVANKAIQIDDNFADFPSIDDLVVEAPVATEAELL
jgi:hypothetical protein